MNKIRLPRFHFVTQSLSGNSPWREYLGFAFLALGYWFVVRSGFLLVADPERVASIWPASGVALAALLISDRRYWIKILSVLFVINALGNWFGGNSLGVSLGFALANTLEAFLCAWVLEYFFKSRITFERAAEVTALLGVSVICNGITALLGAAIPVFAFGSPFAATWLVWWAADGLGIILVTPIIVAWYSNQNTVLPSSKWYLFELFLFIFILVVFALLLFGPFTSAEKPFLRNYMLFPLLIWLAFRFNIRDVANALFMFAVIAIWHTLQGDGIFGFASQSRTGNLIALQIYLSVASFSGLLLSAMVSEKKRAGDALRESEAKYLRLFDNASLGVFQSTPQGQAISVNPAFARMFGYDFPEDVFQSIKNVATDIFVDPNRRAEIIRLMAQNPGLRVFENEYRRKDGSSFIGKLNTIPIVDSEGSLIRIEGIIEDITERIRAENALRASEEKYRMVANFTHDWEAWHAPYGIYLYVSPACERITGYKAEEFINDPNLVISITHPNDQPLMIEHFRSVTNHDKQKDDQFDFRIITKDGETRWLNHSCTAVYGNDGKWLGRRESNRDITSRKQSEAILRSRLWLSRFSDNHTIDELLQTTLNEAEALTESQIGFFHSLDADQKTLTLQMWSTNTLQNMCTAEGKGLHYSVDKAGVWVDCVYTHDYVIYNDYASLSHRKGLPEGHAPVMRILVVPVIRNDLIVAIFGVGNKQMNYTEQDAKTVLQIADLVWDIVQRKRSEDETRKTQLLLNETQRIARMGGWEYLVETKNMIWTDEVYEIHQVSKDYDPNNIEDNMRFYDPLEREIFEVSFRRALDMGKPYDLELRFTTAKGRRLWVQTTAQAEWVNGKIHRLYGNIADITEQKQAENDLRRTQKELARTNDELQIALAREKELSHTDSLTGINNRRYLFELAESQFGIAVRHQLPLSVMMFDIDHFKKVNDNYGHDIGDIVLRCITQVACTELRSGDVIGRYGGEEFVIILPMTTAQKAYSVAERIRTGVESLRVPTHKNDVSVTLSIGIVELTHTLQHSNSKVQSVDDLIRYADEAMYASKHAGRNRIKIFEWE